VAGMKYKEKNVHKLLEDDIFIKNSRESVKVICIRNRVCIYKSSDISLSCILLIHTNTGVSHSNIPGNM
jgi:hypothetical protein